MTPMKSFAASFRNTLELPLTPQQKDGCELMIDAFIEVAVDLVPGFDVEKFRDLCEQEEETGQPVRVPRSKRTPLEEHLSEGSRGGYPPPKQLPPALLRAIRENQTC